MYRLSYERRGDISVLSLEGRYILSRAALSQSGEISPDFCRFYGGGIRHNEDIMHSFQNFIVWLIPNHPLPLETRIWKLVVRALVTSQPRTQGFIFAPVAHGSEDKTLGTRLVMSERSERGTKYDIVTRAIKLILPSLECDNLFITYSPAARG